ncbi:hypothetical protein A6V39_01010 [Candidatus Mycoplasma haematobovis]|uniref:Uncharacterized protein n=1 Tax=Candidatus Mycoplasma haematobovis TaxID=432608 RepID=A0A1A9QDG2_9MOLU|nr:hypothetical protein [Candidatus Mycoplasma haematobovis]OAL10632.1 hypothetical protein A6V39_01010 [Candidatus Mycoplasma haematobovis]
MAFLSYLNFAATLATFGCISFAASNFGVKLGKIAGIQNTLGYQYVSSSQYKDKIYEAISKANASINGAPDWAKDKTKLEKWCSNHEKSTRYWKDTEKILRNIA